MTTKKEQLLHNEAKKKQAALKKERKERRAKQSENRQKMAEISKTFKMKAPCHMCRKDLMIEFKAHMKEMEAEFEKQKKDLYSQFNIKADEYRKSLETRELPETAKCEKHGKLHGV